MEQMIELLETLVRRFENNDKMVRELMKENNSLELRIIALEGRLEMQTKARDVSKFSREFESLARYEAPNANV